MHPDFLKHLRAQGLDPATAPDQQEWAQFCDTINAQFHEQERQRYLLERTLETFDHSQRQYETSLTQAKEAAEMVFQASSDALFLLDRTGRILDINEAGVALFSAGEHELLHTQIFDLLALTDMGSEREFSRRAQEGPWGNENVVIELDGEEVRYFSCRFSPVEPVRGKIVRRVVCALRDRTTQRQHEQRLEELNAQMELTRDEAVRASETKSQFLANMSHELRTPLNAIVGYSELMLEDFELEDESAQVIQQIRDLRKILSAAHHLLSLINDLLDLSRIEAGKFNLARERVELKPLIDEVMEFFIPIARRNDNTLRVSLGASLGWVRGDRMRLKQILANLLSNACKFTHEGTITLTVTREHHPHNDLVRLRVEDTGIGMSPEALHDIFKPFVQADNSSTRLFGGTGLGLTISRRLCRLMGGDLSVESTQGGGSSFEVELLAPSPPGLEALSNPLGEDVVVLLIDDDPITQEIVKRQLAASTLQLIIASDGVEGLMMARAITPDVILLDMLMPRMDGPQVLSRLREDDALKQIPVVLISSQDLEQPLLAMGVDDFLLKPLDRSHLLHVLDRFLLPEHAHHRILIVEDDADVREILSRTLDREDITLLAARDGVEGLELLDQEPSFDLVLLDLMMPRMDGFEFLRRLRQDERWQGLPVVILTAKTLDLHETQLLEQHVSRVYSKGEMSHGELERELRLIMQKKKRPLLTRADP